MEQAQKDKMYEDNHDVAVTVARRFSIQYNRPEEETLDHAEFALALLICEGCDHDPDRLPLKVWLGIKVHWHLKEVYHRGRHPRCPEIKEPAAFRREVSCTDAMRDWEQGTPAPESYATKPSWIQRTIQEIGEEGAALLQIFADAPQDLMDELCPGRGRSSENKRDNLSSYLIDVLDWNPPKVERAFKEVLQKI